MITEKSDVSLSFFTHLNLRQRRIARQLLEEIYRHGQEFAPELFDAEGQMIPVDPDNLERLIEQWVCYDNTVMRRETRYESEIAVTMPRSASRFNFIKLWVEEAYFKSQANTEDFLQLSVAIYDLLCPAYGRIHQSHDMIEMATVQDPRYGRTIVPVDIRKGLPGIYWANFFGPEYVDLIGGERLFSAPGEYVQVLSDGGALVLTTSSPLDPSLEANRARQKSVRDHFGEGFFYHWGRSITSKVPQFR